MNAQLELQMLLLIEVQNVTSTKFITHCTILAF